MRVRVPLPAPLKKQKILIVVGATSSGKSALAVSLARKFNGEVLSADSRQVYRGLDIGTGKITRREMRGVRHHLLDVVSPKRVYTAANFAKAGRQALDDIAKRGKLPIICGGTGFYIDALVGNITLPDVPPNPAFRRSVANATTAALLMQLEKLDPERAKTVDQHNRRRIVRALEIANVLEKNPAPRKTDAYDTLWLGIQVPKTTLEKKIRVRLKARLKQGMLAEAKRLHAEGLSYKRMEALGLEYRALARLLQGDLSRKEMEEELARDIIRYAKRQRTYWKRNKEISWLPGPDAKKALRRARAWLSR